MAEVDGVGEKTAALVFDYLQNNADVIDDLLIHIEQNYLKLASCLVLIFVFPVDFLKVKLIGKRE